MDHRALYPAAAVGVAALVAEGVMELAHKQAEHLRSATDYGIEAAFAVGVVGSLAALALFLRPVAGSLSATTAWAVRIAAGGQGLLGLLAVGTIIRGHDFGGPLFVLGVAGWVLGTVVYAVLLWRTHVLAVWKPVVLLVGTVCGILVDPGGTIVLGLMWAVLVLAGTRTSGQAGPEGQLSSASGSLTP